MLDSEGINGTVPSSKKNYFDQLSRDILNKVMESRKKFVNIAFPRLLYLVSTLFCFVFSGSAKERQLWEGNISTYASQAAAATVNQLALPTLIVVFNKVTLSDGVWDIKEASKQCSDMNFINFFSKVIVVRIFSC
jgi:hypothetical protein